MNAISIINHIRASGGEIRAFGDRIRLKVSISLRDEVVGQVKEHKDAITRALKWESEEPWSSEDYVTFFNERAGIMEFDGGLTRNEAETRAFACTVSEWLNSNPICSPSDRCLGCGGSEQPNDPLLPFGACANDHAWLHGHCWNEWHERRKTEATTALAAMGIPPEACQV